MPLGRRFSIFGYESGFAWKPFSQYDTVDSGNQMKFLSVLRVQDAILNSLCAEASK
jgi:hypothetical protein